MGESKRRQPASRRLSLFFLIVSQIVAMNALTSIDPVELHESLTWSAPEVLFCCPCETIDAAAVSPRATEAKEICVFSGIS
jgi:hypothetical protein